MTSKSFSVEHKYFEFRASYFSDHLYLKIALDESGKRSASGFQSKNGERRELPLVQFEDNNVDWLFWITETQCGFWELPDRVGEFGLDGYSISITGKNGSRKHEVYMWEPKGYCYDKLSDYLFIITGRMW